MEVDSRTAVKLFYLLWICIILYLLVICYGNTVEPKPKTVLKTTIKDIPF